MRIDPAAFVQNALLGLLRQGKDGAAPAFKAEALAPPAASPAVTGNAAPSSLAMLVAVAAQAPGLHRGPALRRAERGIDALGRLHKALLAGAPPTDALEELRGWCHDRHDAEGELAALMREVELRVLVELAKAER